MWTGREMDYYTTAPGVQLYTGNWLGDEYAKDDANYGWGAGFALEAEMYPDTPHHVLFPQGIVGPGHPYSNVIEWACLICGSSASMAGATGRSSRKSNGVPSTGAISPVGMFCSLMGR